MKGAERGRVLVVEDNPDSSALVETILGEEGFSVTIFDRGRKALDKLQSVEPVAVLVDWVLPDTPGIELCREIRRSDPLLPVIFVSGRSDEPSIVRALEAGADDFIVKPVRRAELVARLESHLRKLDAIRSVAQSEPLLTEGGEKLTFGDVCIDLGAHQVTVDAQPVRLGALEFKLLAYFARNPGIAISRDQILDEVYGYDADIDTERVDLLVRRVRGKLGDGPRRGAQIVAIPGYGFRLERRGSAA